MTTRTPTHIVQQWLSGFEEALTQRDIEQVITLFGDECYWRDLVAFTWNLKTLEGKDAIQSMLNATLSEAHPANWQIDGEASEADGVTEAWFTFETGVAHGKGLLRLKNGKCWTLLTTMQELKQHPEPRGARRPMGAEHGASKTRET
ncbi:nuclear transport factor 2 family protein, partial [Halomonas sp. BC04]|uniref:nuclear transport factor 2 family protein n=1 Tax=Halomonas sp. BC04 TaxID=1403540 RepID=UPI0005B9DF9E